MNTHGGKRPGSGRPKGSISASTRSKLEAREYARQRIIEALDPMLDAQIANAQGLKYLIVRNAKTGKFERVSKEQMDKLLESGDDEGLEKLEIWDKDPSVPAFSDLLNRALDKPADHLELTGAEGGPLTIKWQD